MRREKRNSLISYRRPPWAENQEPDAGHFYRRAYTRAYQVKKKVIYYVWLIALIAMLFNPSLSFVIPLALLTTFTSFMILDEMGIEDEEA